MTTRLLEAAVEGEEEVEVEVKVMVVPAAPSQTEPVGHDLDSSQVVSAEYASASTVACDVSTSPVLLFYNNRALTSDASTAESGESRTSVSAEATFSLDPSTSPTKIQSTSQKFPPQGNLEDLVTQGNIEDRSASPQSCLIDLATSIQRNIDNRAINDTASSQGNSNDPTYSPELKLEDPTSSWHSNPHGSTFVPQSNLDNPTSFSTSSRQTNPNDAFSPPSQRTLTELCNPLTVDFAFEFLAPTTGRYLGLWAHQSVLASSSGAFTSLFGLPNMPDTSPFCSRRFYEFRVRISDFSLVAHCALLRFLYTAEEGGEVPDQIDLRDYVLTPIPVTPWMIDDVVDVILNPVYATPWRELLVLARRYHLDSTLGVLCQDKIVVGLTFLDAVPTLLMFGVHYPGMKVRILDWCARTVLRVYSALRDLGVRSVDQPIMLWAIVAGMFEAVEDCEVVAEVCAEISLVMERVARQWGGSA
ncbi:hypothetical protein BG006_003037 [Podila minutissima]|uniref:BTB domain-containing protein n=1 Tax=Podila minutissima TaxID=64525 RepID=A0A9P5VN39_9FUNG|nr:hypothetical protein BG006_003037 [Podila minutissima]